MRSCCIATTSCHDAITFLFMNRCSLYCGSRHALMPSLELGYAFIYRLQLYQAARHRHLPCQGMDSPVKLHWPLPPANAGHAPPHACRLAGSPRLAPLDGAPQPEAWDGRVCELQAESMAPSERLQDNGEVCSSNACLTPSTARAAATMAASSSPVACTVNSMVASPFLCERVLTARMECLPNWEMALTTSMSSMRRSVLTMATRLSAAMVAASWAAAGSDAVMSGGKAHAASAHSGEAAARAASPANRSAVAQPRPGWPPGGVADAKGATPAAARATEAGCGGETLPQEAVLAQEERMEGKRHGSSSEA